MQWLKLMGTVALAAASAACSSKRANGDSATSAGILSDSSGYGVDTNPAKRPGMTMDSVRKFDSLKLQMDSASRASMMSDSTHKAAKVGKKSRKKGR